MLRLAAATVPLLCRMWQSESEPEKLVSIQASTHVTVADLVAADESAFEIARIVKSVVTAFGEAGGKVELQLSHHGQAGEVSTACLRACVSAGGVRVWAHNSPDEAPALAAMALLERVCHCSSGAARVTVVPMDGHAQACMLLPEGCDPVLARVALSGLSRSEAPPFRHRTPFQTPDLLLAPLGLWSVPLDAVSGIQLVQAVGEAVGLSPHLAARLICAGTSEGSFEPCCCHTPGAGAPSLRTPPAPGVATAVVGGMAATEALPPVGEPVVAQLQEGGRGSE